jgi:hypothetical protein
VACFSCRPNLNDGVVITASSLWKLFRLPKWQRDLKTTWLKLDYCDHHQTHLALWSDRVKEARLRDRSVAIGPALLCWTRAWKNPAK